MMQHVPWTGRRSTHFVSGLLRATHHVEASNAYLQHRIELAQYAHLPLGVVKEDWVLSTADALFSRCALNLALQ